MQPAAGYDNVISESCNCELLPMGRDYCGRLPDTARRRESVCDRIARKYVCRSRELLHVEIFVDTKKSTFERNKEIRSEYKFVFNLLVPLVMQRMFIEYMKLAPTDGATTPDPPLRPTMQSESLRKFTAPISAWICGNGLKGTVESSNLSSDPLKASTVSLPTPPTAMSLSFSTPAPNRPRVSAMLVSGRHLAVARSKLSTDFRLRPPSNTIVSL